MNFSMKVKSKNSRFTSKSAKSKVKKTALKVRKINKTAQNSTLKSFSKVKRATTHKVLHAKKHKKASLKNIKKSAPRVPVPSGPEKKKEKKPIGASTKKIGNAQLKFLKKSNICSLVSELAGENAVRVLSGVVTPMSDEQIAAASKTKLSEVRAVLNKLHSVGLTTYERTKDKDTGWFSYTWNLSLHNAEEIIDTRKAAQAEATKIAERAEQVAEFFACPSCFKRTGEKHVFDKAAELEFRCPNCSELLKYVDRKKDGSVELL